MINSLLYIIACSLALILITRLIKVRKSDLGIYLIAMTSLILFWLLMEGLSYFFKSDAVIIFFQKIKYVSVTMITPMLFTTSVAITFGKKHVLWKKSYLFFIIPVVSLLSLLTNQIPYAFIQNPQITYDNHVVFYHYDREIGFYIHVIYSYLMLLLSNVVLVYRIIKSPKLYKNQSYFLSIGSIITVLFNVLFVAKIVNVTDIDATPIFILLSLYIYYWGLYIMPANRLVNEARSLLVENVPDLMVILDNQGNIVDMNNAAISFLMNLYESKNNKKVTQTNYLNISFETVLNQLKIDDHKKKILQGKKSQDIEVEMNDTIYYYQFQRQSIVDENNKSIGDLILLHDITSTQIYLKELISKNEDLTISEAILENARESVIILNKNGEILKVNESMLTMSGYSAEEVIGQYYSLLRSDQHDILFYENIWDSVSSEGYWEGEIFERKKNGEIYLKWMSYTTIKAKDNKVAYYVIISSDISRLKKAEDELVHMAYYDSLTELPNRALFMERLRKSIKKARINKKQIALLYIDIDKFKDVNDNIGHWAGDQLLIAIADKAKGIMKDTDTIARLGGDEFTIILEEVENAEQVEVFTKSLIKVLEEPIYIQDYEINIMISIGIAMGPTNDMSEDSLIRKADIAMYQAKKSNMNDYCFISEKIEKSEMIRNQMNMDLKKAYAANEFSLYLQPQVKLTKNKIQITGAEALIRWKKQDGTYISPVDFIPVAEDNGMIHKIGLWVFEEIFRINTLLRKNNIELDLSINVSVLQFEGKDFIRQVASMLEAYTQPINLTIEITESLFFEELEKGIDNLNKLKALGFKIAMDDFGTGFSSMSYLKRLPLDYVKIDKSFVDDIEIGSSKNLATMMLSMANILDLKTVGEGVETQEQATYLTEAGCDLLQGYLYSKPLELQSFITYIKDNED